MPRTAKKKTVSAKPAKRKTSVKKSDVVKTPTAESAMPKPKNNKKIFKLWGSVLLLIILLGLAYLYKGLFIVAMVNGKPISRFAQIERMQKTVTQNGQTAGKESLDNLITEELISQEAKNQNIVISDADIQKEIDNLTKSVEAQGTTLDAALATRGMTKEELQKNIKLQKTVEALLSSQLAISDDELKNYFDDNKDFYGANAKFEDLKDTVKSDMEQEKFSTEFQKWYQKLQTESDIKYFVSF